MAHSCDQCPEYQGSLSFRLFSIKHVTEKPKHSLCYTTNEINSVTSLCFSMVLYNLCDKSHSPVTGPLVFLEFFLLFALLFVPFLLLLRLLLPLFLLPGLPYKNENLFQTFSLTLLKDVTVHATSSYLTIKARKVNC